MSSSISVQGRTQKRRNYPNRNGQRYQRRGIERNRNIGLSRLASSRQPFFGLILPDRIFILEGTFPTIEPLPQSSTTKKSDNSSNFTTTSQQQQIIFRQSLMNNYNTKLPSDGFSTAMTKNWGLHCLRYNPLEPLIAGFLGLNQANNRSGSSGSLDKSLNKSPLIASSHKNSNANLEKIISMLLQMYVVKFPLNQQRQAVQMEKVVAQKMFATEEEGLILDDTNERSEGDNNLLSPSSSANMGNFSGANQDMTKRMPNDFDLWGIEGDDKDDRFLISYLQSKSSTIPQSKQFLKTLKVYLTATRRAIVSSGSFAGQIYPMRPRLFQSELSLNEQIYYNPNFGISNFVMESLISLSSKSFQTMKTTNTKIPFFHFFFQFLTSSALISSSSGFASSSSSALLGVQTQQSEEMSLVDNYAVSNMNLLMNNDISRMANVLRQCDTKLMLKYFLTSCQLPLGIMGVLSFPLSPFTAIDNTPQRFFLSHTQKDSLSKNTQKDRLTEELKSRLTVIHNEIKNLCNVLGINQDEKRAYEESIKVQRHKLFPQRILERFCGIRSDNPNDETFKQTDKHGGNQNNGAAGNGQLAFRIKVSPMGNQEEALVGYWRLEEAKGSEERQRGRLIDLSDFENHLQGFVIAMPMLLNDKKARRENGEKENSSSNNSDTTKETLTEANTLTSPTTSLQFDHSNNSENNDVTDMEMDTTSSSAGTLTTKTSSTNHSGIESKLTSSGISTTSSESSRDESYQSSLISKFLEWEENSSPMDQCDNWEQYQLTFHHNSLPLNVEQQQYAYGLVTPVTDSLNLGFKAIHPDLLGFTFESWIRLPKDDGSKEGEKLMTDNDDILLFVGRGESLDVRKKRFGNQRGSAKNRLQFIPISEDFEWIFGMTNDGKLLFRTRGQSKDHCIVAHN
eukprot:g835.t1